MNREPEQDAADVCLVSQLMNGFFYPNALEKKTGLNLWYLYFSGRNNTGRDDRGS